MYNFCTLYYYVVEWIKGVQFRGSFTYNTTHRLEWQLNAIFCGNLFLFFGQRPRDLMRRVTVKSKSFSHSNRIKDQFKKTFIETWIQGRQNVRIKLKSRLKHKTFFERV